MRRATCSRQTWIVKSVPEERHDVLPPPNRVVGRGDAVPTINLGGAFPSVDVYLAVLRRPRRSQAKY